MQQSDGPHDDDLRIEEVADGIVLFTLNRPHAKNAVSFDLWEKFDRALSALETRSPPRALILCGAADYFSTGGDMKVSPARGAGPLSPAKRLELGQRIIARLQRFPSPVIAAVEGAAYGIAWSLALAADLIFAGENAVFGGPFINLGLVPDGGLCWLLPIASAATALRIFHANDCGIRSHCTWTGDEGCSSWFGSRGGMRFRGDHGAWQSPSNRAEQKTASRCRGELARNIACLGTGLFGHRQIWRRGARARAAFVEEARLRKEKRAAST